ncbi:cysteine--tRNA ligase [Spiroplasma taiwanense]|uniref:Cysteine--tRNA ligase n=1 Tax=Spiroplasma taiwanense CT-1 TaxID=1276220 RepID=S5LYK4_9MOLU|nr:cysteine--tRNA ligase [Spiroplasma taiwanense]AGR40727.1 cysteinyl-tRNA synthetase [Spiroplasma taiwanense CT-1]
MKLYDSLTTELKMIDVPKVCIYTCGPTVYDYIHIGNARPLILTDLIIKYLEHREIKYKYLLNITDIDDKIIKKSMEMNISEENLSQKYTKAFLEDLEALNITKPTDIIPISSKINEILKFINELIEKDYAYEIKGNVYFNIARWEKKYGNLSKQNINQLEIGNRVEEDLNKKNPQDFVLWKKTSEGKKWLSKWSLGRPGWHTECALLIDNYFKAPIDIHVGGIDLKFPHHENERIQYLAKNLRELSTVWLHNGHVSLENTKMSKSLNNTILVRDFINDYGINVLRYIFLNSNYKQPLNITKELILQSSEWVEKVDNLLRTINWLTKIGEVILTNKTPIDDNFNSHKYITRFRAFIKDDLNTPLIISLINEMTKNINKQLKNKMVDLTYIKLLTLLKILGFSFEIPNLSKNDVEMIRKWNELKLAKNFTKADKIREILKKGKII